MNSTRLETFLARLLVDSGFRQEFLHDPRSAMAVQGLDAEEREAALQIDHADLVLAARSFAAKRTATRRDKPVRWTWWKSLVTRRERP